MEIETGPSDGRAYMRSPAVANRGERTPGLVPAAEHFKVTCTIVQVVCNICRSVSTGHHAGNQAPKAVSTTGGSALDRPIA